MHILNPTHALLTLALVGVVAVAIITSSLQVQRGAYVNRSAANATKDPTIVLTGIKGQYASAWQRLKSKSEGQIRDNDMRIGKYKTQMVRAGKTFRATYDKRVAELEQRNIALKGKLDDYKGDRGNTGAEIK